MIELNDNTYVYCTECVYGNLLIDAINNGNLIPVICLGCYPYNPEDSMPFSLRKEYCPKDITIKYSNIIMTLTFRDSLSMFIFSKLVF